MNNHAFDFSSQTSNNLINQTLSRLTTITRASSPRSFTTRLNSSYHLGFKFLLFIVVFPNGGPYLVRLNVRKWSPAPKRYFFLRFIEARTFTFKIPCFIVLPVWYVNNHYVVLYANREKEINLLHMI